MAHWYDHTSIYQLYPKSFADTNGDGIGDLRGIKEHITYLKNLGIDTIWLNPIYQSPQVDNGYDVADYQQIDPIFGTLTDFKDLIAAVHEQGLHLIMDLVLNHTSDQHPWFKQALADPHSHYRDFYLWQTTHDGQVPNNWQSFFGGSVWEPDPHQDKTFYFHLFDRHMPDLNWANPQVRQAMIAVGRYWLDLGVDGFRLDAMIHLAKADFRQSYPSANKDWVLAEPFFANLPQVQTYLHEFAQAMKTINPECYLVGEAASASPQLAYQYTHPREAACDSIITFRYFDDRPEVTYPELPARFQPHRLDWLKFKQNQAIWQSLLGTQAPILYWNNHDLPRAVTRFGDHYHASESAKALAIAMYLQRGIPLIYYGEELGLENSELTKIEQFQDLEAEDFFEIGRSLRFSDQQLLTMLSQTHKMAARAPFPWQEGLHQGFSTGTPWLPVATTTSVAAQHHPGSVLALYRQLLTLRRTESVLKTGEELILPSPHSIFAYQRYDQQTVMEVHVNLSDSVQTWPVTFPTTYQVVLKEGQVDVQHKHETLGPWAAWVITYKQGVN